MPRPHLAQTRAARHIRATHHHALTGKHPHKILRPVACCGIPAHMHQPSTPPTPPATVSHATSPAPAGAHLPPATVADPRPALLLATVYGMLVWHLPPAGLALVAAGTLAALLRPPLRHRAHPGFVRGVFTFIMLWTALKAGLDLLTPQPDLHRIAADAALFGARLGVLAGIGCALTLAVSPRQLGLALVWLLRPILGGKAWQPALALTLMVHFIPLTQQTVTQARLAATMRNISGLRRLMLIPAATLRLLGQRTWSQTVAVAARGLDRPEAWQPRFAPCPTQWACALLLAAAGWGLLWLRLPAF